MNTTTMRRLGDYIRQVDVRNRDLELTTVQGINIGKYFFPSVANLIGTDLSKYKLVQPDQFACNFMHVGRDEKIPVARNNTSEALLVSSAYYTFKVFDEAIMPEYLELVFKNPNFDREAWFHTDADVRSGLGWKDFCDLQIPVPPIEKQREIVAQHKAIEHKIDVIRRLIAKLEETARTIYRHTFVENIDPENLPDGWELKSIIDFCNVFTGKRDANEADKDGEHIFFTCGDTPLRINSFIYDGPAIIISGNGAYTGRTTFYLGKFDLYQRTYACTLKDLSKLKYIYTLYMITKETLSKRVSGGTSGSAIPYIVMSDITEFMFPFNQNKFEEKGSIFETLIREISLLEKQNEQLKILYNKQLSAL